VARPASGGRKVGTPEKRPPSSAGRRQPPGAGEAGPAGTKANGTALGGIKVAVRVRPEKPGEVSGKQPLVVLNKEAKRVTVTVRDGDGPAKTTSHDFDYVYDANCEQKEVYEQLAEPLLGKLFNWYNGTLFAYGQTGTGKTHSMFGPEGGEGTEQVGMIPRMIREIFRQVMLGNELRKKDASESKSEVQSKLIVKVTYLEIYQERLVDLLVPKNKNPWDPAPMLKIRYHPDTGVYVEGAAEPTVTNFEELRKLMSEGDTRRQVASHDLNERSSRSHAVFTVKLFEVYDTGDKTYVPRKWARLNMCDLAGSERQKQTHAAGVRLVESSNINKGLLTLQRVIKALAKEDKPNEVNVVPFRESKLTQLLEESLGGTALCCMIACASPADTSTSQTALTLRYASSARRIKKVVVQNKDITETNKLKGEVEQLMKQLADAQSKQQDAAAKQYEDKIARLEQVLSAEAKARANWEKALAEERRRAMLNATVPGRVALYLQAINSPVADTLLQLEHRIGAAEAEYFQVLQLVESLEGAVQAEIDVISATLPTIDDNALERLVVQLRTVQGETHKLKKLRDSIISLYKELNSTASAEAERLLKKYPNLSESATESVTGDEVFIQPTTHDSQERSRDLSPPQLALQGVVELQRYAAEGGESLQKTAWGGSQGSNGERPRGFQVDMLMSIVEVVEEQHPMDHQSESKPYSKDVAASVRLGGTLRLNVIDYAVDTLDAALANFRKKKAEAFEDFLKEHQELQERVTLLRQVMELKEMELKEVVEQRDELMETSEEKNLELERLQAALNEKVLEAKKAHSSHKVKNKALKEEVNNLQADLKAVHIECTRLKDELGAGSVRQSEADHRAGELSAEVVRYRDEAARLQVELSRHEQTSTTVLQRRDELQEELNSLRKQLSELQMATAVEGKSAEHILKALQDADSERESLRNDKSELQKEVDALKALSTEQQAMLVELQKVKLSLADAEAKATMATREAEHVKEVLALGAKDQELLDIVKKLLAEQSNLSNSLTAEEIAALKEQKALLEREVQLRREATERAQAEARLEVERKAALQRELDGLSAELAELKQKKAKACVIM